MSLLPLPLDHGYSPYVLNISILTWCALTNPTVFFCTILWLGPQDPKIKSKNHSNRCWLYQKRLVTLILKSFTTFQQKMIEGNCKFEQEPFAVLKGTAGSESFKACRTTCQLHQKCLFYVFDSKRKVCNLYATPYKQCSSFIGIPDTVLRHCRPPPGEFS